MQNQNELTSKHVVSPDGKRERVEVGAGASEGVSELRKQWRHLDARAGSWRKQLSLKGRGLTVGQLVSTIRANKLTNEQASANLDLPREAIEEALAYYEENRALIEEEAEAERRWLAERGYPFEPQNIP